MQAYIAKTYAGLEPVLAEELRALGATGIKELRRAVQFDGDKRMLYRANYELRTALRILVPVHSFPAFNEQELYEAVRQVDWSTYMNVDDTLAIDAVTQGETFRHSQYAGQITKDAIVDQFRERYQRRPDVNLSDPTVRINLHIRGTHCDLSLDSSGDSLHRRGYRREAVEAPLSEVLAAGMILLSGWDRQSTFVDPMCGSGTLPIEAAMLAMQIPAQRYRPAFGFFAWPDFDKELWHEVFTTADKKMQEIDFQIIASDIDPRACATTTVNLICARLEEVVQLRQSPFENLVLQETPGILMMNPPYDERMEIEDAIAFYKNIGDCFKKQWPGWNAWVISSNREALKNLGLRASRRITLFNGPLECSFQKFEMYAGSKVY